MLSLPKAIAFAANIHSDHYDKGGEPYILHCVRVMQTSMKMVRESSLEHQRYIGTIAVLHDTIEDGPKETGNEVEDIFGHVVRRHIEVLTRKHNQDYLEDYIRKMKYDKIATTIKLADLQDNLNILRQPNMKDRDLLRLQKYHMAYRILKGLD